MKDWTKGSFTVEAAMIMGVVLFVIMSVLSAARTVYNRTLLTVHAYEVAVTKRESQVAGLWGTEEEEDISIELDELEPVSFLWKSQWIRKE